MGIVVVLIICGLWKADIGNDGGLVLTKRQTEVALRGSVLAKVFEAGWLPMDRALKSSANTVNLIKLARQKDKDPESEIVYPASKPKKARTDFYIQTARVGASSRRSLYRESV